MSDNKKLISDVDSYYVLKEQLSEKKQVVKELNKELKELEKEIVKQMYEKDLEEFETEKSNVVFLKQSLGSKPKK